MIGWRRYLGIVLLAALWAAAWVGAARGEERPAEMRMVCVTQMAADVAQVADMHGKGVPSPLIRYLIVTDQSNRDEGRWLLASVLRALDLGMPRDYAHTLLWELCGREPGAVAEPWHPSAGPAGGWGLLDQHKDL